MTTTDVLNIILTIGVIIIVTCIAFVTFFVIQALKAIKKIAESLEDSAKGLSFLKDKFKLGALGIGSSILTAVLTRILKKGR